MPTLGKPHLRPATPRSKAKPWRYLPWMRLNTSRLRFSFNKLFWLLMFNSVDEIPKIMYVGFWRVKDDPHSILMKWSKTPFEGCYSYKYGQSIGFRCVSIQKHLREQYKWHYAVRWVVSRYNEEYLIARKYPYEVKYPSNKAKGAATNRYRST